MNQTDMMHPDQAILTLAGIYLYFQNHADPTVSLGMTQRIEKRWKAFDQPLFILALVLNPFKGVTRFGDSANASQFTLTTLLLQVCYFFLYFLHKVKLMYLDLPTST